MLHALAPVLRRFVSAPPRPDEQDDLRRLQAVRTRLEANADPVGDVFEREGAALQTTVGAEARSASVSPEKGLLLYRLVRAARPSAVTEFGSCFGVSGAHVLAALRRNGEAGRLTTVEGSASRREVARRTLEEVGPSRYDSVLGYFDDELGRLDDAELVFIDGNHQVAPTLRYVDAVCERSARPCTIVLDDITGWADDFSAMWRDLCRDPRFTAAGAAVGLGVLTLGHPDGLTPSRLERLRARLGR